MGIPQPSRPADGVDPLQEDVEVEVVVPRGPEQGQIEFRLRDRCILPHHRQGHRASGLKATSQEPVIGREVRQGGNVTRATRIRPGRPVFG
jgi:hypothetical protein